MTRAVGTGGAGLPSDFGRDRGHFQTFQRPCSIENVANNRAVPTDGGQEGNCPPGFFKDRQSIATNNDHNNEIVIESTNFENDETVPDVDEYEEIRIIHRRGLRTLFATTSPHFAPVLPHFAPATLTIRNVLDKNKKTDENNENDKNDQNDKNEKNDENDKNDQNDNNDQNDQNDRNEKNDEADKDDENDNPDGYLPLKTQFRPRVTGLTRD